MKSDDKLWEIALELYQRLYAEAEPPMDFMKEFKAGKLKRGVAKEDWYMDYYLPSERQYEIEDEIAKKYRLNRLEREKIGVSVFLGAAPRGVKNVKTK